MKAVSLALVFVLVALAGCVSAHPVCSMTSIKLDIVRDVAGCEEACRNYTSNIYGDCFAYVYEGDGDCFGSVFDFGEDHDSYYYSYDDEEYSQCGASPRGGGELTIPDDPEHSYTGCHIQEMSLGIKQTQELCQQECAGLQTSVYGGCIAWFYNPDTELCGGAIAAASYSTSACYSLL